MMRREEDVQKAEITARLVLPCVPNLKECTEVWKTGDSEDNVVSRAARGEREGEREGLNQPSPPKSHQGEKGKYRILLYASRSRIFAFVRSTRPRVISYTEKLQAITYTRLLC